MFNTTVYRMMIPYFQCLGPKWSRRWLLNRLPIQDIRHLKATVDVMDKYTKEIFFGKRAALVAGDAAMKEQIAEGKDIMSILCKSEFSSNCQLVALIS